ncbi:excreted virulence factor EspC (type VII ESX diderm) [Amycolatopsis sulphurea]|uniref:Excreted virulence factor EspC (Type VII ESX diderm) n=1 Tax=Amycolatopsis sulphurea TaxID=76022 RepID=A0A2A9FI14_9PSEU|nr:type VII secretion target [Amycolatopsis sulphurea]PFG51014.1 excreted virulence factor EspC (type VII ESX diderm) [Amycolatopsis sulphurea]
MGFETMPGALRAAGRSAGEKVGGLRGADCAEPVGRVAGAVRGGNAATAAGRCREALATTFTEWCAEAQRFGDRLGVAADRYQQGDHAAAGAFPAAPGMRGPR